MVALLLRRLGSTTTVRWQRLFVVLVGLAPVFVAIYRAPIWLETWNPSAVVGALGGAVVLLALAIGVSMRGSADTVKRVAVEVSVFACTLIAVEAILLGRAPERWPDHPLVQRMVARERAALAQGIAYDARLRADVVREWQSRGVDAVPGLAQGLGADPAVSAAIRARRLLPLSNVSNALVVECNEGLGFLAFRSDELGFNNPRGLVSGPVDVAVIGESLALGHCVPRSSSAVGLMRTRFPRTANFGVAGARVLSELAVFREYVEPLKPPVVVWFVNTNFAEPREEIDQPVLMKYLNDPSFSQRLRRRQEEVDSFARELLVPLNLAGEDGLRAEIEQARSFPLARVLKLREIRGVVGFASAARQPRPAPDLSHFSRAVALVLSAARAWGGRVVIAVLPSYPITSGAARNIERYEAVLKVLDQSGVSIVDGPALFAAHPDVLSLYMLGIDNHPSERGHALIADAIIAAIEREVRHESVRDNASH